MVKLKSKPLVSGLPLKIGKLQLRLAWDGAITAIMPNQNGLKTLSVNVGEVKATQRGRLVWAGLDQSFLFGEADKVKGAYTADISDGWVFFALEGEGAGDALARLVPVDLRREVMSFNQSIRTQLGHLQALIISTEKGYEIGVMSSFAQSAMHELETAMQTIAARSNY